MKEKLNPIQARILTVLIKNQEEYLTTSEVANKANVSWNTALAYLNVFYKKGWVDKSGERTIYWNAIIEE